MSVFVVSSLFVTFSGKLRFFVSGIFQQRYIPGAPDNPLMILISVNSPLATLAQNKRVRYSSHLVPCHLTPLRMWSVSVKFHICQSALDSANTRRDKETKRKVRRERKTCGEQNKTLNLQGKDIPTVTDRARK